MNTILRNNKIRHIGGSMLSNNIVNVYGNDVAETLFNTLRDHVVVNAAYDSLERENRGVSICMEETRTDVLQEIEDWAQSEDGRSVCWLYGPDGQTTFVVEESRCGCALPSIFRVLYGISLKSGCNPPKIPLQYGPNLYSNPLLFSDYPHHMAWVIHADYSISSTKRSPLSQRTGSDPTAENTPSDIFAFLPPLLFFGVANNILEIIGFSIDNSHFVDTASTGRSTITTEHLRSYIDTWSQLPRHTEALAKLYHRLNAIIVGKFSNVLFHLILTQPHISNGLGVSGAVRLIALGVSMLTEMLHHSLNATKYNQPEAISPPSILLECSKANQMGNLGWCPNQIAALANFTDVTAGFCLGSFVCDSAVTLNVTDCGSFAIVSAHLLADTGAQEVFTPECMAVVPYYQYHLHDWTVWVAQCGVQCIPDGPAPHYGMVSSIHSIAIVSLDLGASVVKQDKVTMESKALNIAPMAMVQSLYSINIHSKNFWGHLPIVQHTKMHIVKTQTQMQKDDSFLPICAPITAFQQLGLCSSEEYEHTGKIHTSKDAISVTHCHFGVNRYFLSIAFFASLFGTVQADISADSGVNQALIAFEAALTNVGLAIVAFATILQYTGGFARRVSPLESLKAKLVWLTGGINMDELNLSIGLKEDNMTPGHVMPLTAIAAGRSILATDIRAQERGTLVLGLHNKIPTTIAVPVVKIEYALVGWITIGLCASMVPSGLWWDSYGAYASALFLIYIIAFQSVALSLGWISDQKAHTIHSIEDHEIKRNAIAWLTELKALLDAWDEQSTNPQIRQQNPTERLWLIKFLMQWAFGTELVMENCHTGKLNGDWISEGKFRDSIASYFSQCAHDINNRLARITTVMTGSQESGYINLLAWATHVSVNTFEDEHHHNLHFCRCRDKPLCIYTNIYTRRSGGERVYLSSINFMQPQSPGKWMRYQLFLYALVASINILYCYPVILIIMNTCVPVYGMLYANVPGYGNLYGCLNCNHDGLFFRNGTLLPHQKITRAPFFSPTYVGYLVTWIVIVFMSLLATAIIGMPAVFPRLFKYYDRRDHRWLCLIVRLLAHSFKYDKVYMALTFSAFGAACAISSGFKTIPPNNTGFLGWTSTTSYTYALLLTGITAAIRHGITSGERR